MGLIKRITDKAKFNELISFDAEDVFIDYESLKVRINVLKEVMSTLSKTRRKNQANERLELIDDIFRVLDFIDVSYDEYLYDLNTLCGLLEKHPNIYLTPKVSRKVSFVIKSRIEIRKEFEAIYSHFKKLAKGYNDVPMKEILTKMREVFDLDSKRQNENYTHIYKTYQPKYFDATIAKINKSLLQANTTIYGIK